MSKHIAFFVTSFKIGGVERAFVTLANSFVEGGHKVDFIVSEDVGELKGELNTEVTIIDFKSSRLRESFVKLFRYLKTTKADCIISGPTYPNVLSILCNLLTFNRVKVIVSQHSYQDIEMINLGLIGKFAPFFTKRTYNLAEKVIAVSEGVRADLINNYSVRQDKVVTIYNAVINNSFFVRANEKMDSSIANQISSKPYLVAVGRLELVKNFSFMLQAYAKLKSSNSKFNHDLVILGDGTEKDNLKNEIKHLGIGDSVHLLGSFKNPLPIIKGAKLFIHSSFSEAMPLVYVEALALRVPIVTINNSGAEEILKGVEAKMIIPFHNQDEFIAGIEKMLASKDSLDFPNLEEFRSEKIRDQYLELLQ